MLDLIPTIWEQQTIKFQNLKPSQQFGMNDNQNSKFEANQTIFNQNNQPFLNESTRIIYNKTKKL